MLIAPCCQPFAPKNIAGELAATVFAELYGVSTKRLKQQVKRNARRFPNDFVMQLSAEEAANLRSQFVTSSSSHGGQRYRPYAFTEHGAIMAASVLNSERADDMSIFVVRAFVRMREALAANQQSWRNSPNSSTASKAMTGTFRN